MTGRIREDLDPVAQAKYDEWRTEVPTPTTKENHYLRVRWEENQGFVPVEGDLKRLLKRAEYDAFNSWRAKKGREALEEQKKKGRTAPPVSTFDLEDLGL